jgi:hypothetical protein
MVLLADPRSRGTMQPMSRMPRSARLLAGVASLLLIALVGVVPASAAGIPLPASDPFYRYTGSAPLATIAPGTILKQRAVTLALGQNPVPLPAEQLLYRTADEVGKPSVTVTTVLKPALAAAAPKVVAYLSFYDSLSGKCDPSYTLQGGDPGASNTQLTDIEQALVLQYYSLGWVTTVPDFEGTGLHWTAGHEAGYGTLDAIRATETYLKAPASTPVGLSGYSGGSIAADWASELAPGYAKELNLVGVAEAGIPVDFAHNLTYVNGSQVWSGILPAVLVALSRAYGLKLDTYLSAYGKALTSKTVDECIGDFSGTTPGGTIQKLLKPQYQDFLKQPVFVDIINKLIMGTVPGHPKGPLLMMVGNDPNNAQGQGDDIMVTKDVEALAHEYCGQGVPLQYSVLSNSTHEQAAVEFEPQATAFLAERFAGVPFSDNCASVGPGNDISPIVLSRPATRTSNAPHRPAAQPAPARARAGLPSTGLDPLTGWAALGLLVAGGALLTARRGHR